MEDVNNTGAANGGDVTLTNEDSDIQLRLPANENSSIEVRMSRLETMLSNLTENLIREPTQKTEKQPRARSPSWSSVDSNMDESKKHRRRQRSPSKLPDPLGYEAIFPDEELKVINFEGVMLALFKSLETFIDEGRDINGLIRHGRYLSEKAVADVYTCT